ncbi:arsenate reductase ArsC [Balneolaceae bacterium YR4-1]|uniref:Arsenate reductase ArsC n=1 Tax=Halalkalibaculum roseum TaxID=2709311 RepID=A0A6M1SS09_9BACT|nr:arsenate reductase ArsC [Halalkalibaculum roseum]NGP75532.1 arsenate reductase ArsC [Halalkalibaculum roseum]
MTNILILCTGNSCRSQMAHGWMEHLDIGNRLNVYSAGIETHGVNPKAIQVMKEAGTDISHHTSNHIDEYRKIDFDYVITVCDHAKEHCPYFPSDALRIHQNFKDPAQATGTDEEILTDFRRVRDEIKEFVEVFVKNKIS